MSVLVKTSASKIVVNDEVPKGEFNKTFQIWQFENSGIFNHTDFSIYMSTGTPTTYSATTSVGKDKDTDDRGT